MVSATSHAEMFPSVYRVVQSTCVISAYKCQVKSGHVNSGDIRDLVGTLKRENAAIGVFITLEAPTQPMRKEAMSAGSYHSLGWNKKYPTIQILTVIELLKGVEIQMPPQYGTFREAQRIQQQSEALQLELGTEP